MPVNPDVLADFADRFTEFWRAPDPQALPKLLAEHVHLEAPLTHTTDGLPAAIEAFERLLAAFPGLTADVHRWGAHDDGLFVEFTLRATVRDQHLAIRAIDDIRVGDNGLATERISYFDPSPIL